MGATELWLVRHGESVANVAAQRAEDNGDEIILLDLRDADIPLSPTGERQARALGDWIIEHQTRVVPTAVTASSYYRAKQTISIAMEIARLDLPILIDERLRDRELGVLDLLTSRGVEARFPDEAERRRWLGKFYYRPPGGESWADVALRLRSFLRDVDLYANGGCILVAAHDAVVMVFLYLCGGLTEQELLDFAQTHVVANASVTRLVRPSGEGLWKVERFSDDEHLRANAVPVTEHSGDERVKVRRSR